MRAQFGAKGKQGLRRACAVPALASECRQRAERTSSWARQGAHGPSCSDHSPSHEFSTRLEAHRPPQDFLSGWSSSRSRGAQRGKMPRRSSPPPPSSWRRGTSYQVFVLPQRAPDVPRRSSRCHYERHARCLKYESVPKKTSTTIAPKRGNFTASHAHGEILPVPTPTVRPTEVFLA